MKYLSLTLLGVLLFATGAQALEKRQHAVYGIHLFFNEKEFIDELQLDYDSYGEAVGTMIVPGDFTGKISSGLIDGLDISFNLFVPKNSSRPQDLVFHYQGKFFDMSRRQINGYVTIVGHPEFVASFVGFARP